MKDKDGEGKGEKKGERKGVRCQRHSGNNLAVTSPISSEDGSHRKQPQETEKTSPLGTEGDGGMVSRATARVQVTTQLFHDWPDSHTTTLTHSVSPMLKSGPNC